MITAHHLVVVVISNMATPLLEVETLRTEEEAAVLSMITAHHLVVVVVCNTATPLLEVENNVKIKTLPTAEEAAVLSLITAHHLVVVVIRNMATEHSLSDSNSSDSSKSSNDGDIRYQLRSCNRQHPWQRRGLDIL
jgi:hypothetical protein